MAKKHLRELMDGIIGKEEQQEPGKKPESGKQTTTSQTPRQNDRNKSSGDKSRTTFIIPNSILKKIKYIALWDETLQQDIVAAALSEYISKWEKENGNINIR